jgi:secreted trypsin-like serine protease
LWAWDDAYEEFSVEKEYTHPDYDETTKRFDQKVLKLSGISQAEPLTPKTDFSSISMELMDNLNIVGFGQPDSDGTYPSRLQYVQQRYVPFEECTKLSYNGTIYDDMICAAGNNQTTTGDCFGDSGEPLILQGSGPSEDVQIGWVSWYVIGFATRLLAHRVSRKSSGY